jgi:hypothetical protein
MRYSELYAIKAQRAVETGLVDVEAFIQELLLDGVPDEQINALLVADLEEGGPLFGKYFRSLGLAGESVLSVAESQGSLAAEIMEIDKELEAFMKESQVGDSTLEELAASGDPEALEVLDAVSDHKMLTWICKLRRTCEQCLPLHGKTLSRKEWRDRGLFPGTVHTNCMCVWELSELSANRSDLVAPLRREIKAGQKKGGKLSVRAITSNDVERAQAEVQKALNSKQGRKMLQRLGQSGV